MADILRLLTVVLLTSGGATLGAWGGLMLAEAILGRIPACYPGFGQPQQVGQVDILRLIAAVVFILGGATLGAWGGMVVAVAILGRIPA